ncbi:hypothetical protein, partial [Ruminococcus sp.]
AVHCRIFHAVRIISPTLPIVPRNRRFLPTKIIRSFGALFHFWGIWGMFSLYSFTGNEKLHTAHAAHTAAAARNDA